MNSSFSLGEKGDISQYYHNKHCAEKEHDGLRSYSFCLSHSHPLVPFGGLTRCSEVHKLSFCPKVAESTSSLNTQIWCVCVCVYSNLHQKIREVLS